MVISVNFFPSVNKGRINKSNSFENEPPFLDLHLSSYILDEFISCKMYGKRGDFDFEFVTFLTWMGMFLVEYPRCLYIATTSVRQTV